MDNWVLKRAMLTPNRVAVTDGITTYTYSELLAVTKKLGKQLSSLGALNSTRIGLLTNNTVKGYLVAMALLLHGKTIVWLNKRLTNTELDQQLSDAQVEYCLQEDELSTSLSSVETVSFSKLFSRKERSPATIPDEFADDHVVSIMFTSGSTGRPKGVQQTVLNHYTSTISVTNNLGLNISDEWLCAVPIFHISGFSIMMRGILLGVTVRLVQHFTAEEVTDILVNEPISWMSVVPTMLKQLVTCYVSRDTSYSTAFKGFILGGEKTDVSLLEQCDAFGLAVIRSYGMTETCSQIVASSFGDVHSRFMSVGKPFFSTQLRLDDTSSEILLKTPALTKGYMNQPQLLKEKLVGDGWYRTGDVGHFDNEHYLYVDGRLDNMIISGGEHIFTEEVERVYALEPTIAEVAVTSESDDKWGRVPVAYVVLKDGTLAPEQLRAFGRQRLAHYKVPTKFYSVQSLPKTSTGKVQRFLLRK